MAIIHVKQLLFATDRLSVECLTKVKSVSHGEMILSCRIALFCSCWLEHSNAILDSFQFFFPPPPLINIWTRGGGGFLFKHTCRQLVCELCVIKWLINFKCNNFWSKIWLASIEHNGQVCKILMGWIVHMFCFAAGSILSTSLEAIRNWWNLSSSKATLFMKMTRSWTSECF